jgi:signal transduction histidine kinase
MARELHDTLAQGLGAISVHLELIKSDLEGDAKIREQVEKVRLLARASMADVRKSIWNMRSQVLETGDLAAALAGILETLAKGNGLKSEMRVLGRSRRLAPVTENNLLRIGQEAIANAVKHARAGRIEVVLEFGERELRLTVRDDGGGFDLAHPSAGGGGFGLVGMRERAAQLHGELSMVSKPGQGTVVTMTLPLPG